MAEDKKLKVRKKKWVPIMAPKLFNNVFLGESVVYESAQMVGKPIAVNLMVLINDPKAQNTTITFVVSSVDKDIAYSQVRKYEVMSASIKRLVRKGKRRIDMSFTTQIKDGKKIRLKPFMLVKYSIKSSASTKVQHTLRHFLTDYSKKNTFEDIISGLISGKLQDEMSKRIRKIYPVKICEIRSAVIEEEPKAAEKASAQDNPQVQEIQEQKAEKAEGKEKAYSAAA